MKKTLLKITYLCLFFTFSHQVNAQEVFIVESTNDTVILPSASIDTYTLDRYVHFYHDGASDLQINWDTDGYGGTNGWTFNVCEGDSLGACYPLSLTSAESILLSPDDTSYLKVQFIPNGIVGNGTIPVEISIAGNPSSSKMFYFYMQIDSFIDNETAIEKIEDLTFNLYPNPASELLNISLPSANKVRNLSVYNVLGKEVLKKSVKENTQDLQLNVASFKSGVYIVKLISASNKVSTRTFVVK